MTARVATVVVSSVDCELPLTDRPTDRPTDSRGRNRYQNCRSQDRRGAASGDSKMSRLLGGAHTRCLAHIPHATAAAAWPTPEAAAARCTPAVFHTDTSQSAGHHTAGGLFGTHQQDLIGSIIRLVSIKMAKYDFHVY